MQMQQNWQISKRNTKGGQQSFNMREAWNPVCYYGNKTGMLILSSISNRFLIQIGWDIVFKITVDQNSVEFIYHLANLQALKLEYEVFVNSKQSSHTDHLFIF